MRRQTPTSEHAMRSRVAGIAAVEFVAALPVLLMLYFGGVNTVQLIAMHRRMATAAELVADLISRHDSTISVTSITDYFTAAELAIRPASADNMRIQVYDYYRSGTKVETRWSRSSPNGTACTTPAVVPGIGPIGSLLTTDNLDVVVAVVCVPFSPPVNFPGLGAIFSGLTIEKQMALQPRTSSTIACTGC